MEIWQNLLKKRNTDYDFPPPKKITKDLCQVLCASIFYPFLIIEYSITSLVAGSLEPDSEDVHWRRLRQQKIETDGRHDGRLSVCGRHGYSQETSQVSFLRSSYIFCC